MLADDLLVLYEPQFSERVREFFNRMNQSPAFQQIFIKDPARTLAKTMFVDFGQTSPAKLNQANRLLYSLLSNQRFMEWARRFQRELDEQAMQIASNKDPLEAAREHSVLVDRRKLYRQVIEGIRDNIDTEILYSLIGVDIKSAGVGTTRYEEAIDDIQSVGRRPGTEWDPVYAEVFVVVIAVVAVHILVTQVDFTPVHAPLMAEKLTRDDLQRVADVISQGITKRANELRQDGSLTP